MPGKRKSTRRSGKAAGAKRSAEAASSGQRRGPDRAGESGQPKRSSKTSGKTTSAARRKKIAKMKQELLERLESLRGGMEQSLDSYQSTGKGVRGDVSDLAADSLDGDTELQLAESGSSEIAQIGVALGKIEDGGYGACTVCGGDIPWSRLEAVPYATTCIECKRKQEITGGSGEGAPGWSAVDELEGYDK